MSALATPTASDEEATCWGCIEVAGHTVDRLNGIWERLSSTHGGKAAWHKYIGDSGIFNDAYIYHNPGTSRWEMSYSSYNGTGTGYAWFGYADVGTQDCPPPHDTTLLYVDNFIEGACSECDSSGSAYFDVAPSYDCTTNTNTPSATVTASASEEGTEDESACPDCVDSGETIEGIKYKVFEAVECNPNDGYYPTGPTVYVCEESVDAVSSNVPYFTRATSCIDPNDIICVKIDYADDVRDQQFDATRVVTSNIGTHCDDCTDTLDD
jgi:hypothetical protein